MLLKFPEIDRDRFLAMILQESNFDSNLICNQDYGLCQVHLPAWKDRYGLNKKNILDERNNLYAGAQIWVFYAHEDYGNYCYGVNHKGKKPNVILYKKKLKIIKGIE